MKSKQLNKEERGAMVELMTSFGVYVATVIQSGNSGKSLSSPERQIAIENAAENVVDSFEKVTKLAG